MMKEYIGGRIVGGCSLHEKEKPELCPNGFLGAHASWRVVDCCGVGELDIVECSRCGKQKSVRCDFDEEYS